MKILLKQPVLLLGLMTAASAYLSLPASDDLTADSLLRLKCPSEYTVNVWKRRQSGELLYRGIGPLGSLSLGKGENDSTGTARVYKFQEGGYAYLVLEGTQDHQGQGRLEVIQNRRSILSQACTPV